MLRLTVGKASTFGLIFSQPASKLNKLTNTRKSDLLVFQLSGPFGILWRPSQWKLNKNTNNWSWIWYLTGILTYPSIEEPVFHVEFPSPPVDSSAEPVKLVFWAIFWCYFTIASIEKECFEPLFLVNSWESYVFSCLWLVLSAFVTTSVSLLPADIGS